MLLKHTWTEAKCTTFTSPCLRHDSHTKPPTQTTIKDVHILERHDVSGGNQSQPCTRTRTHTTTIYSKLYIHDVLCQQRHSAIPIGFCIITSIFPLQKKNYTSSFWQGKSKMKKKRFQSETMPRNKYCKTSGLWNKKSCIWGSCKTFYGNKITLYTIIIATEVKSTFYTFCCPMWIILHNKYIVCIV